MYSGAERRRYPRADAGFLVSYKDIHSNADFNLTQMKNISQSGILFTTSEIFKPGTQLKMLAFLPFFSQRINIVGRVARQKEVVKGLLYETGVELPDLEQVIFDKIGEFVTKNKN